VVTFLIRDAYEIHSRITKRTDYIISGNAKSRSSLERKSYERKENERKRNERRWSERRMDMRRGGTGGSEGA
jgi:hypothetical protein